jgi:hypothetical protein
MWRSFFLAVGVYVCLLGVEALAVERAVLKPELANTKMVGQSEIVPPDWAPWSLLAAGAVVSLYSFTIPMRVQKG